MNIPEVLKKLKLDDNDIYIHDFINNLQKDEIKFRKINTNIKINNYLSEIALHHSIPVMDRMINKILKNLPKNSFILDIGGSWGWHWRNVNLIRPDIKIIIIDFVYENLLVAKNNLTKFINKNIFLVHCDATNLPFDNEIFDLCWSVQVFEFIPNINDAIKEAERVMKKNSLFYCIGQYKTPFVQLIYYLFKKKYHSKGLNQNNITINKFDIKSADLFKNIFDSNIIIEFSEFFFHPNLQIKNANERSLLAKIDSFLTGKNKLLSYFARQISFKIKKN